MGRGDRRVRGHRRASPLTAYEARAEYLYNLVEENPGRIEHEARELAVAARSAGDTTGEALALRAAALAARTRDAATAERIATAGADIARGSGLLGLADRVLVTLAGIQLYAGRMEAARAVLDEVVAAGRHPAAAEAIAQQGLLALETGMLDEAVTLSRLALDHLPEESIWRAHAHTNRGLAQAYAGYLDEAELDLEIARSLYDGLGCRLAVAESHQNLGWIMDQRGDYVGALEAYSSAEPILSEWSSCRANLLRDRATTLLAVGLAEDAASDAREAVEEFAANGLHAHRAECLRITAMAFEQAGRVGEAADTAECARELFLVQNRVTHADQARLISIRATGRESATLEVAEEARSIADRLGSRGSVLAGLEARLAAAQVAAWCGDHDAASDDLDSARIAIDSPRQDLRMLFWESAAQLAAARQDDDGALAAAAKALDVLDELHRTLGSTEARVNVSAAARKTGSLAMRIAHDRGAESLFDWTERVRAGALRFRPVRPERDQEIALARSRLRVLSRDIEEAQVDGDDVAQLTEQTVETERRLRLRLLEARGQESGARRVRCRDVQELLGDRILVAYAAVEGHLVAIRLGEDGVSSIDLGPTARIQTELDQLRFSTVRLAAGRMVGPGIDVMLASARRLDELVMGPVDRTDHPVIVVPMGAMFTVPWGFLPSFESRPFSIVPSATMWAQATRTTRPSGREVLAAGPGLEHASREIEALSVIRPQAMVFDDRSSIASSLLAAADGADLLHIACHGQFRSDNPMFSNLRVADGPLAVHELETLDRAPSTVVLSSCDVGRTQPRPGEEWLGMATALLTLGTRSLIASVLPVPDAEPTVGFMQHIHRNLVDGVDAATALHRAGAELDHDDPAALAAKAAFICVGS